MLATRNIDVNEIDKTVVPLLDSHHERVYTSVDSANRILPEYLNSLNPQNLPSHVLQLRVNSIVMLMSRTPLSHGLHTSEIAAPCDKAGTQR